MSKTMEAIRKQEVRYVVFQGKVTIVMLKNETKCGIKDIAGRFYQEGKLFSRTGAPAFNRQSIFKDKKDAIDHSLYQYNAQVAYFEAQLKRVKEAPINMDPKKYNEFPILNLTTWWEPSNDTN